MILLIVADVMLRRIFNQPLAYSLELVEATLPMVVFFGIVVCTARQGHIDIGVLVMRFPQRVQAAISSSVYFLTAGLFSLIAWRCFVHAMHHQQLGTVTIILRIPIFPFFFVVALCSVVATLLFLSQFIHFTAKAVSE